MTGSLNPWRPCALESGLPELLESNVTQLDGRSVPGDQGMVKGEGMGQNEVMFQGLFWALVYQNHTGSSLTND